MQPEHVAAPIEDTDIVLERRFDLYKDVRNVPIIPPVTLALRIAGGVAAVHLAGSGEQLAAIRLPDIVRERPAAEIRETLLLSPEWEQHPQNRSQGRPPMLPVVEVALIPDGNVYVEGDVREVARRYHGVVVLLPVVEDHRRDRLRPV